MIIIDFLIEDLDNDMKKEIDVIITASSRPELIDYCLEAFKDLIRFSGKMRFILHEDFIFPAKSELVIVKAKKYKFDVIFKSNPSKGLGWALMQALCEVKTKYCFYLQEDWEFEKSVDLDAIIEAMEEDKSVNSIIFNKNQTLPNHMGFQMKERQVGSLKLCTSPGWFLLPAVWRTDFIRSRWQVWQGRPEGCFTKIFGSHEVRLNPEYVIKHMGTYFYGGLSSYRFVRHLGDTWRMAKWRLEKGKPGGNDVLLEYVNRMRDPSLGPLPQRPSTKTKSGWFPE